MGVINGSWHIHIYKVLPLNSTQLTMTTEKKTDGYTKAKRVEDDINNGDCNNTVMVNVPFSQLRDRSVL